MQSRIIHTLVKSGKKTYVEKVNWNKEIHFDKKKKNSNIG